MKVPGNIDIVDNIIVGRVDPKIYAFTTETVPNYLKVGDTYRPIETRLDEWRSYFPNLEKKFDSVAKVDDEIFFRDHAVHYFLEHEAGKQKLKKDEIKDIPYYSQEFFKGATKSDIENAIKDIKNNHKDNQNKYQYYKFEESRVSLTHTYKSIEEYGPIERYPFLKTTILN